MKELAKELAHIFSAKCVYLVVIVALLSITRDVFISLIAFAIYILCMESLNNTLNPRSPSS